MLGVVGKEWLAAYIDESAAVVHSGRDAADWLVVLRSNIERHAHEIPFPTVMRSMACLEQMCHHAFRAPRQLRDAHHPEPPFDQVRLRLHASTEAARLEHDVVRVRQSTPETAETLPHGEWDVVVYRSRRGGIKQERVPDPAVFDALIELTGRPLSVDELVIAADGTAELRAELVRLFRWGAVTTAAWD
jgi:hypothetical protein